MEAVEAELIDTDVPDIVTSTAALSVKFAHEKTDTGLAVKFITLSVFVRLHVILFVSGNNPPLDNYSPTQKAEVFPCCAIINQELDNGSSSPSVLMLLAIHENLIYAYQWGKVERGFPRSANHLGVANCFFLTTEASFLSFSHYVIIAFQPIEAQHRQRVTVGSCTHVNACSHQSTHYP